MKHHFLVILTLFWIFCYNCVNYCYLSSTYRKCGSLVFIEQLPHMWEICLRFAVSGITCLIKKTEIQYFHISLFHRFPTHSHLFLHLSLKALQQSHKPFFSDSFIRSGALCLYTSLLPSCRRRKEIYLFHSLVSFNSSDFITFGSFDTDSHRLQFHLNLLFCLYSLVHVGL